MSVHVHYRGRFGNHLFQYVCARLFAEKNGLKMMSPLKGKELGIVKVVPPREGKVLEIPIVRIGDNEVDPLGRDYPPARYVFDGYFQKSDWYYDNWGKIESFLFPDPIPEVNTRDILANLRIADGYQKLGWVIHPTWYLEILKREKFDRLHIVTDALDEEYIAYFKDYDPVVVACGASGNPKGDWEYIRKFDRIICSNSTFAWWACFFARASRIYTFKRWVPHKDVRLGPFPNGVAVDGPFMGEVK